MSGSDCREPICKENPFGALRKNLAEATASECPLDRGELGRYSWSLLHTFAVYYPELPTTEDKERMKGFLEGWKYLYPCVHCRGHFQRDYDRGKNTPYV